tara:strand:+ start:4728 stop:5333 length:606 start_codon:yes stop_codon:yes gene_type:complete
MSDKNIRSVAYLYNEMDPSEKVEFERDLKVDENLLIEVETLRKVSRKLQDMDTIQPPDDVVNSVLRSLESRKSAGSRRSQKFVYFSAAAVLMLGLTVGFILSGEGEIDMPGQPESESASIGTFQNVVPASMGNANSTSETDKLMPWVDHNDVLHFRDGLYGSDASSVDSIFRQSFQKLTPITNPSQSPTARQNLHLTGSQR